MTSGADQVSVRRVAALLGTLVALTVVGSSAVAVALPELSADLDLTTAQAAWVLAAFSLTFSIATAIFGRMADLAGLRRPLRVGAVLFSIGSLAAALTTSFPEIVAARLLQGAGAGAVPVLSIGIINARFSDAARARAIGGLTAVVAVVSGSGPFIGGALTELLGWRAVLALPVAAIILTEPVARLAPDTVRAPGRVDLLGAVLLAGTVTGMALVLQAPAAAGGWRTATLFAVMGTVFAAGLALRIRIRPHGFLPRSVVTNGALMASAVVAMSTLGAYIGMLFAVPEILTGEHGWSPLLIGVAMLPGAALAAVLAAAAGRLASTRYRHRTVAALTACSAVGLLIGALSGGRVLPLLVGFGFVAAGFGGAQVVLVDGIPRLVPPAAQGVALGVFNVVFFTGGAIGAAATGGLAAVLTLPGALAAVAVLPVIGTLLVPATRPPGVTRRAGR